MRARFPGIVGPDTKDICYATQNRQRAARELAMAVDVVLVVGAANSSNSNRLREIAEEQGVPAYLIADADALDLRWLEGARSVGITAGASAPAELVQELIDRLRTLERWSSSRRCRGSPRTCVSACRRNWSIRRRFEASLLA